MPTYEKVNGQWREIWSAHVKVDGFWRDIDLRPHINGDWTPTHRHTIVSDDVKAVRIIYSRNDEIKHPLFPNMKTNLNMPITTVVSGTDGKAYSMYPKGIILNYERFGYEEGKLLFEGRLYLELMNGCFIDVAGTTDTWFNNKDERRKGPTSEIKEVWTTNRIKEMDIRMKYYTLYEAFRYNMYGWNSFFSNQHFLPENPRIEDASDRKKFNPDKPIILNPKKDRPSDFVPYTLIGICRALKPYETMTGAYGIIDHTIEEITVNGVKKPFSVEIYNE
jgi:hypothetical protein